MQKSVLDVVSHIAEDLSDRDPYGAVLMGNLLEEVRSGPYRDATYSRGDLVQVLRRALLEFHSYQNLLEQRLNQGLEVDHESKRDLWQQSLSAQRIAQDLDRFVWIN